MERLSISLDTDLATQIRAAAAEEGATLSAWLARAAETELLLRRARQILGEWEEEHGEISEDELRRAELKWAE